MSRRTRHQSWGAFIAAGALVCTVTGCTAAPNYGEFTTLSISSPQTSASSPRVAVIGDSIESGLGLIPDQAWPELVATKEDWNVSNYSASGSGYVAIGADGVTFEKQVTDAINDKAQIVLIGASDNDLGTDITRVEAAMKSTIAQLREGLPSAKIIGYNALSGHATDSELAGLDAAVQQDVKAEGGLWINIGEPYRRIAGLVQGDNEHPTAAGQQVIARLMELALTTA